MYSAAPTDSIVLLYDVAWWLVSWGHRFHSKTTISRHRMKYVVQLNLALPRVKMGTVRTVASRIAKPTITPYSQRHCLRSSFTSRAVGDSVSCCALIVLVLSMGDGPYNDREQSPEAKQN